MHVVTAKLTIFPGVVYPRETPLCLHSFVSAALRLGETGWH
jgi:hypothetical protein